jgi:hypothetical protein
MHRAVARPYSEVVSTDREMQISVGTPWRIPRSARSIINELNYAIPLFA